MRFFLCIFILFSLPLRAQDMQRVKSVIDTLCAPGMHGRGYVNEGDKIAANYLEAKFREIGLKAPAKGYQQKFQLPINTFPKQAALQIGRQVLVPGVDFIADAASGPGYGKAKTLFLDSLIFNNEKALEKFSAKKYNRFALVYDAKYEKAVENLPDQAKKAFLSAAVVIVLQEKLTASLRREQLLFPKFHVKKSSLKKLKNRRKVVFQLDAVLQRFYETQNVIGILPGKVHKDSFLVVCAHYDHLGTFGEKVYFPGANDNASGTAMMLELAHYFAKNPLNISVVFIAFGAEEAGLVGSYFFNTYPSIELNKIKFVINVDLFGTGEEGITAVNAEEQKEAFKLLEKINEKNNYLSAIKKRGQAANSDHYFFSQNKVPAMFFYLMGDWPHYHDIFDDATVPLTAFDPAFKLMRDFISEISSSK